MSDPHSQEMEILGQEVVPREQIIARFEEAHGRRERPKIEDYLTLEGDERGKLLLELVHVDLECRVKAGEPVRVERYLERYPELAGQPIVAADLICAEFTHRRRREPGLTIEEFLERFPAYRRELAERLEKAEPAETPGQVRLRLNCPHCQNPIAVLADSAEAEVVCPSCGSTFRLGREQTVSWRPEKLPRLGKFDLLEAVGRGAFGTVYRARDAELDRIVAVKVPRSGTFATQEDEDRFVREARSVAQLHHSGIIPVYEVGHAESFPYIVTEYVEGVTLGDALTGRRFGFRESAEIVVQIAEALEHSHRQGVIHRDLKPSNIMLQEQGGQRRALLMDFGLARREEGEATVTADGQVLGTPAYMSPEQARGEAHRVDGRSDVYSLGVILYELLVGELPFRGNLRMILHQVLNTEPQPPRKLNDGIPRDLETICLKCVDKEPARRYESAGALAEDLRCWLSGQPISARPVGKPERAWRWCKRNPTLAALTTAVALLLVLVAVGSTVAAWLLAESRENERSQRIEAVQSRRNAEAAQQKAQAAEQQERRERMRAEAAQKKAEQEEQHAKTQAEVARRTSDFLASVFQSADPIGAVASGFRNADTESASKLSAEDILKRGAALVRERLKDQPIVQAEQMDIIGSVCRSRGMYDVARQLLEESLRIRQQALGSNHPQVAETQHNLAWLNHDLGNRPAAEKLYRQALEVFSNQAGREGELRAAATRFNLAWVLAELGQLPEAETMFREVLAIRQKHLGQGHRDLKLPLFALLYVKQVRGANLLRELGTITSAFDLRESGTLVGMIVTYTRAKGLREQGKYADAEPLYREVLSQVREAFGGDENLFVPMVLGDLAGMMRQKGDMIQGEALIREALKSGRRVLPNHPLLANGERELADVLWARGDFKEAELLLQDALRILAGLDHPDLAAVYRTLGYVAHGRGEYQQAESHYRRSLAIYEKLYGPRHLEVYYRKHDLANCLHLRCAFAQADGMFRDVLKMRREVFPGTYLAVDLQWQADFLRDVGRHEEAAKIGAEALGIVRKRLDEGFRGDMDVGEQAIVAQALGRQGDLGQIEKLRRALLAWTRKQWRQEHFNIVPAIVDLAQVLAEKTEFAEAERLYRQAILIRQKGLGRDHPATTEIQMQLARVLFDAGRREEAILLGRETLASRQTRLGSDHPRVALSALDFAAMSSESGDHAGAEKLAREAYAVLRKGLGDAHPDTTAAMVGLAEILLRKGDAAAAHDVLREGRSGLQKLLPARSWRLALVDSLLGGCLVACKPARFSEAEPPLLTGHKTLLAAFGPSDPRTKQAAARIVALYEAWGKPDQAAKYRAAGAK